jgi:hypothetical protein
MTTFYLLYAHRWVSLHCRRRFAAANGAQIVDPARPMDEAQNVNANEGLALAALGVKPVRIFH